MAKKMNGLEMLKSAIHPKKHEKHKKHRKGVGLQEASASVQGQARVKKPQETMREQTQKFKKHGKHMKHEKMMCKTHKKMHCKMCKTTHSKHKKMVKTTGKFEGKSNKLGHGGRAAQLKAAGVPGGVIGNLARRAQAAPGMKNFHAKKKA